MSATTEFRIKEPEPVLGIDSQNHKRATLLVIDDEMGPRQSLHMVFKDDYNVLMAEGGQQAIELASENQVDAAVLDIRMPGMSGVEVLSKLKEIDPSTEVVMLTAYETIETARQALRLGACDYLTKPFDLATMRAAVATAIERHELSRQISSNNSRLSDLQEELHSQQLKEEIVRNKGEIYQSILHDINGPLTIISGFIEIINQHLAGATSVDGESLELVKDRLGRITRQVNSCVEITQRYLSFLRRDAGHRVPVGTSVILKDLQELLRVHPSTRCQELRIHPLPREVYANINGTDLIQMLLNLTINALQASPEKHTVHVRAERLSKSLDLDAMEDSPNRLHVNLDGFSNTPSLLSISVKDDGPGIPSEVLPRILEPCFSTKPTGKGTGLGLAIVHRFIKENNGLMIVETELGKGTEFTLYFDAKS